MSGPGPLVTLYLKKIKNVFMRLVQIAKCSTDNDNVIKFTNKRDSHFLLSYTECFLPSDGLLYKDG